MRALLAGIAIAAACGPHPGTRCTAGPDCGDKLMCNGTWPQMQLQPCKLDSDCPRGDGNTYVCTSAVLNGVTYDHVCVHPGVCVPPEQVIPR